MVAQMAMTEVNEQVDSYRMQIKWNAKTTEWFQRASEYTGFHDRLCEILLKKINGARTVADFGCGAGMIDFKLANYVDRVTCIDREPVVTHILQKEIMKKNVDNMEVITTDINTFEDEIVKTQKDGLWDVAIMLFVNAETVDIKHLLKFVKDRLIIVERGGCINNPYVGEKAKRKHSLIPFINHLFSNGICAHVSDYTLEYGQPFTSLKEAREYTAFYHCNGCNQTVDSFLEKNLHETNTLTYPYYLPHKKHFGVFEIRKNDNK
ncbi:MAG: class I SAM-dependent methyltransferase [Eubacterium sp.]|nr:class I SAM-dependent methyltransferase [Eubacterium sp.]